MENSNVRDKDVLKKNLKTINYVRHHQDLDISAIADAFGVSWPTMKTNFTVLYKNDLLSEGDKPRKHIVNSSYGVMLGLSIGATETKITLIDFSFDAIDWSLSPYNYLYDKIQKIVSLKPSAQENEKVVCFETAHNFLSIYSTSTNIISTVFAFCKKYNLNLLSVGIALPGVVDKKSQKMIFCPNIPELVNINVNRIVSDEILDLLKQNEIAFHISHDATAVTVFEKEWNYKQYFSKDIDALSKNMAVIYMGSGLASGYIFENRLLLGTTGTGEIGHLDLQYNDLPFINDDETCDYVLSKDERQEPVDVEECACMCGKANCLETLIRAKVFNSTNMKDFLKKIDKNSLASFKEFNPYRYRVLCHFISQLLNITINMLNVDRIVLTGRVFNGIPQLKNDIKSLKIQSSLGCFSEDCDVSFGSTRTDAVAIGAAILSYYYLFNDSNNEMRIEW